MGYSVTYDVGTNKSLIEMFGHVDGVYKNKSYTRTGYAYDPNNDFSKNFIGCRARYGYPMKTYFNSLNLYIGEGHI